MSVLPQKGCPFCPCKCICHRMPGVSHVVPCCYGPDHRLSLPNRETPKPIGLDHAWEQVREFHLAFGAPAPERPVQLSQEQVARRIAWVKEELEELEHAGTLVDQADAINDAIYFLLGGFVEAGLRPQRLMDEVHRANMRKLFPDGMPRRRESDGKTIKPPGWYGPEAAMVEEVERQIREAEKTAADDLAKESEALSMYR